MQQGSYYDIVFYEFWIPCKIYVPPGTSGFVMVIFTFKISKTLLSHLLDKKFLITCLILALARQSSQCLFFPSHSLLPYYYKIVLLVRSTIASPALLLSPFQGSETLSWVLFTLRIVGMVYRTHKIVSYLFEFS